jgi:hypothetical protein
MSDRDYGYFEKQVKDALIYQSEDALVNLTKVYDILEDLKAARAERDRLSNEVSALVALDIDKCVRCEKFSQDLQAERDALKDRVKKLREALGYCYYNNLEPFNYTGKLAREALAVDDEKEKEKVGV